MLYCSSRCTFKMNSHQQKYVCFFIVRVCVNQIRNMVRYGKTGPKSQGRCKTFQMLQCIAYLCIILFPDYSCYPSANTTNMSNFNFRGILVGWHCTSIFHFTFMCCMLQLLLFFFLLVFFLCLMLTMACFSGLPILDCSYSVFCRIHLHFCYSVLICYACNVYFQQGLYSIIIKCEKNNFTNLETWINVLEKNFLNDTQNT